MLRVAFVYNFAKYVEWPKPIYGGAQFELCLSGSDSVIEALQRLKGQSVQQRKVTTRVLHFGDDYNGCQLLFVGRSEESRLKSLLANLKNMPMLTISNIPGFAKSGGMIELFREKKKLRFAINLDAAQNSGLSISSRLLKLARIVGDKR